MTLKLDLSQFLITYCTYRSDKHNGYDYQMDTRSTNAYQHVFRPFHDNHAYSHDEVVGTRILDGREHRVMRNEFGEEVRL